MLANPINNVTLPTLYEHYTAGGIQAGLSAARPEFTLNGRPITIYSGAMHYFRVPPAYWRDRLRKMRAAGLNAVETYIPWNLHEPEDGWYDFGEGGSEMEQFLHVEKFLRTAQEEDLLTIIRPGPYICTEWDFGGFPSWLLRKDGIKLRTSDSKYMEYVRRYFSMLLPILALFQFTRGGSIVAFQVENEYGSTEQKGKFEPDRDYLRQLRQLMLDNDIVELLVTSDSPTMRGSVGTLPGIFLQTANFADEPESEFHRLQELQPNKPVMAMEFWGGWFDHWGEKHHVVNPSRYENVLERILKYPASVNIYMFHGGTNWGFMNGANLANGATDNSGYQPDTTSYDYDAPLTEAGYYTVKYRMTQELLAKYNPIQTRLPAKPTILPAWKYTNITVESQILLDGIVEQAPIKLQSPNLMSMEMLPINNNSGQSYGYLVYRKEHLNLTGGTVLKIKGHVCDTVVVLLNGMLLSKPLTRVDDFNRFGFWRLKDSLLILPPNNFTDATLDLVVENWGRNNFGHLDQFNQFKGLWQGGVYLNNKQVFDWTLIPLEFKRSWTKSLKNWQNIQRKWAVGPALYRATFEVDLPRDTFIDMREWIKGIVIVNNFVLGRYAQIGPQQTLYLPAPFLKNGINELIIFEHYAPADKISFSPHPIFKIASAA